MKEEYAAVALETLNKGDVVHVSFNSPLERRLYLNLTVSYVTKDYLSTEDGYTVYKEYSRFYMVKKAKKPLPTELGAVVEHTDGWRFLRVGKNRWVGVGTEEGSGDTHRTDAELENASDGDPNWKRVA